MNNPLLQGGEIVLSGAVLPDQYIYYDDEGAFSPSMVRRALNACEGQPEIVLRVNSPGGDPAAAEEIRMMLVDAKARIIVRVAGDASSAASLMVMGADRIEMSAGSVMMIHDPSIIAFGNADSHSKTAERLDAAAQGYAAVYAKRAGMSVEEARALMVAETWMTAQDAVSRGFADAITTDDAAPRAPTDVPAAEMIAAAQRHHTEIRAMMSSRTGRTTPAAKRGETQAGMAEEEKQMSKPNNGQTGDNATTGANDTQAASAAPTNGGAQMSRDQVVAEERRRSRTIMSAARTHMASGALSEDFVNGLIDEGVSVEMASHRILQQLSDAQPDISMSRAQGQTRVGREDVETRREGLAMALTARISGAAPDDDRARPYMDMSMHEMAAASMGAPRPGFGSYASRENVIMSAMQTGSDFPGILSLSVNRVLEQSYELAGRTFTEISREMEFNDFREHTVVRPDEFPTLQKVNEAGEIKFGSIGDSAETVALAAYATGLRISRQALVNDDMGAIQDVIDNAAAIVPEFEENLFWTLFLSNPTLQDGKGLFHTDHGNLAAAGSAISVTSISDGRKALRGMKAADGKRPIYMNSPSILLVGPENETLAEQFVAQNIQPTKPADTNPFNGKLRPVVVEGITGGEWYLLVDPAKRTHSFKHGYLRGQKAPRVRVQDLFGTQGVSMTLEHDFGAGGVNHRGAYKNPGK